jgi:hypothetical protein
MPVARRESEDSYLCVVIFKVFTENCLKSGGREESMNKKVSKMIFLPSSSFSSGLRVFTARHHLAMAGADKTIIRRGKNNAQAKTWKLTLHQNAQRKIIVFTTQEGAATTAPSSCLFEDTEHCWWSDPGVRHAIMRLMSRENNYFSLSVLV